MSRIVMVLFYVFLPALARLNTWSELIDDQHAAGPQASVSTMHKPAHCYLDTGTVKKQTMISAC